jgi:AcrR family transcriptional regulator
MEESLPAATRILHATIHLLVERGATRLSLQDVADAAGVSKGLIHYHYHDKDTLLTRAVEWMAAEITRREREALANATPRSAVDDIWRWLDGELRLGHVRALLELAQEPSDLVREAVHAAALARRAEEARTLQRLFTLLNLRGRLPPQLVAEVSVAFVDGLVIEAGMVPEQDPRVAFDVFWLGMLSLTE